MNHTQMAGANGETIQTGADVEVVLQGGNVDRTKGRTIYIIPGGTVFAALQVDGLIPGGHWVQALDEYNTFDQDGTPVHVTIDPNPAGPTAYVVGADYLALRVLGIGGDVDSTLEAGLIA